MRLKKYLFLSFFLFLAAVMAAAAHSSDMIPASRSGAGGRTVTIFEGVKIILKDSRLIKIEKSGKDMAFEDTVLALSPLLPHLKVDMIKSYNQYVPAMIFGATSVPMGDKDPISWGADIYQTLFDFGKSLSNYKASTDAFHARKAKVESVKRAVTIEFIAAYFNLLESEKMIAVSQKEVDSLTAYLKDMDRLYTQGVIVKNDLLPARVKLADARQKLIASGNRREVAAARLATMLTMPLTEEIGVVDIKADIPDLPEIGPAWETAIANRPEVTFFTDQIKSSISRERALSVENLPTIFADGGYAYTQNKYMVHQDDAYIKLGAKMDLYDGGATGAQIMKERYLHDKLREEKNKLVDDVKYEVKESLLGVNDAIEKLGVAREAFSQAEENVRFYRVKYNNGVATSTDVLEAISLETKAQTNYYSADYELKRSHAKLIYSIGGDLAGIYKNTEK